MADVTKRVACVTASVCLVGGVSLTPVSAQEAPRYSITGEAAVLAKRAALENAPYSLQYGRLKMQVEGSLEVEFNDNVNLAEAGRQHDLIIRPQVKAHSFLPLTAVNSLNLSVGVSPAFYVQHSEYNRVLITPGSELAMDLYMGDYLLNLHEQFSYTQDPIAVGSISGTAVYGGFNNTAGATLIGDLNDLSLSLGYDHTTFLSSTTLFEQLNSSSENFNSHATFQINRAFSLGLSAGGGFNHYEQKFLNDHRNYSAGADAAIAISPRLKLNAAAGVVFYRFDRSGTVGATPDQNSYYVTLGAEHQLGQDLKQFLRATRELRLGITSDVLEVWAVRYQADLRIAPNLTAIPRLFYEHGRELKGVGAEQYDRYGVGLGFTRQLSEKVRANVAYNFTLKDSGLVLRSYWQNSVTFDLTYRF